MKALPISEKYPAREIALDMIRDDLHRLRNLQPKKVDSIATSMKEGGLISPLTVRPVEGGGYQLVAGRHRLHAASKLNWRQIWCFVRDLDDDGAELVQIDENLARNDLTAD